jgi:transketolase
MCKGLEGYEDSHKGHGLCLSPEQYNEALNKFELGLDLGPVLMSDYRDIGKETIDVKRKEYTLKDGPGEFKNNKSKIQKSQDKNIEDSIKADFSEEYKSGQLIAGRDAFGAALLKIGRDNVSEKNGPPVIAIDCDLKVSVKTDLFEKDFPENFIQAGIAEHNAAAVAGAISKTGFLTFFAGFAVFGIDEVYNQLRLNDINDTSLKLVCTHNGLEVGEDGKSHHCLDYLSLVSNLFNFKIVIPADANQTAHITNYISSTHGNFLMVLNRSKIPVLSAGGEKPFFGKDYVFKYGKSDWLKNGTDATIITYGHMAFRALEAAEILQTRHGIKTGVLNVSSVPLLDDEKLQNAINNTKNVVVYEDHNVNTGIGTMIGSFIAENKMNCNYKKMGVSKYGVSADTEYQYKYQGLDVESLVSNIINLVNL